ncbi:MAG: VWA domain-containing protein, partial [Candidatus Kapaibacterium sp.]
FEATMGYFAKEFIQYDVRDFTTDKDLLKSDLNNYVAGGGTNYNAAFLGAKPAYTGGAFSLVAEAQYKPVIIFMTDGYHQENPNHLEIKSGIISSKASQTNTTIFSLSIGPTSPDPDDSSLDINSKETLKGLSRATGGDYYENLLDEQEVADIYSKILQSAQGFGTPAPCYLDFESDCNDGEIELTYSGFNPTV